MGLRHPTDRAGPTRARARAGTGLSKPWQATDAFLATVDNLWRYHREHEKYYARAPLEEAAELQRTSAALKALAERWSTVGPRAPDKASPFAGAEDLNDDRATELALALVALSVAALAVLTVA